MAWFGKSEEELKEWQKNLDQREITLNEKLRQAEQKENDLTNREKLSTKKTELLAQKDYDLSTREIATSKKEVDAKNKYVSQLRKAFKDAIENQLKELDKRSEELDQKQNEIEKQFAQFKKFEGEVVKRERTIKEAELNAENGFADQNKVALREIEKREKACLGMEDNLKKREDDFSSKQREMEKRFEELRIREAKINEAEIKRDEGFSEERKMLDEELSKKRSEFLKELSEKREKEFNEVDKIISKKTQSRISVMQNELSATRQQHDSFIQKEKSDLKDVKDKLISHQAELDELKDELEYQRQRLQSSKDTLNKKEQNIIIEVDTLVEKERAEFHRSIESKDREIQRYIEESTSLQELLNIYKKLEHDLGEDPQKIKNDLAKQVDVIKSLQEDISNRSLVVQDEFDRIKSDKEALEQACERLSEENKTLVNSRRAQAVLEDKIEDLERKNKILADQRNNIEAHNNKLQNDLEHLSASYEGEEEREERISHINNPLEQILYRERASEEEINEIEWLDGIQNKFDLVGYNFPNRILKAFHSAMKTAEWSPLTVLAGVSGTGKSKLPELYAQFGGLNFLNTPVQPNWDSTESMLGFYNSIDNYFDAQPVLRFLAQTQLPSSEKYPEGLSDVMNLILLDEMNLAHIELYFADFLSKLEERRGKKKVPSIAVKIGAKLKDRYYHIPLGRNVLWVGTMNQDETTKSLSDKVLDRGIVINFPRPDRLERMNKISDPTIHASDLITKKQWGRWWAEKSNFTSDQIKSYKCFVEEMNSSLSKVGRALGHRVWQSIEYYMSNYPDVMEAQRNNDDVHLAKAMKIAFEDQLVQKVMPKLRGIETRGKSKSDCLEKIRTQLVNNDYKIIKDFDLACEFGYGQFIWNSANYLNENEGKFAEKDSSFEHSYDADYSDNIPEELIKYAKDKGKKLWSLTLTEIKNVVGCDAKEANQLKEILNSTKEH